MPQLPAELIDEPASFETLTGEKLTVPVHFNPANLQYTVANTLKEEGKGAKKKQYVSQTTAKLTMDLVFDTTDSGEDVRVTTDFRRVLSEALIRRAANNHLGHIFPGYTDYSPLGIFQGTDLPPDYSNTIDRLFASGFETA